MTEQVFLPAHELARQIRRKQISALELLDRYLSRIARLGGGLGGAVNALPVLDVERARARARAADAALAKGERAGGKAGGVLGDASDFDSYGALARDAGY